MGIFNRVRVCGGGGGWGAYYAVNKQTTTHLIANLSGVLVIGDFARLAHKEIFASWRNRRIKSPSVSAFQLALYMPNRTLSGTRKPQRIGRLLIPQF